MTDRMELGNLSVKDIIREKLRKVHRKIREVNL